MCCGSTAYSILIHNLAIKLINRITISHQGGHRTILLWHIWYLFLTLFERPVRVFEYLSVCIHLRASVNGKTMVISFQCLCQMLVVDSFFGFRRMFRFIWWWSTQSLGASESLEILLVRLAFVTDSQSTRLGGIFSLHSLRFMSHAVANYRKWIINNVMKYKRHRIIKYKSLRGYEFGSMVGWMDEWLVGRVMWMNDVTIITLSDYSVSLHIKYTA